MDTNTAAQARGELLFVLDMLLLKGAVQEWSWLRLKMDKNLDDPSRPDKANFSASSSPSLSVTGSSVISRIM
jgi:hypothetical protein